MILDYYEITRNISNLFNLLEDQQSKKVFLARLQCDIEKSLDNLIRLFCAGANLSGEQLSKHMKFGDELRKLSQQNQKVFIYGTGVSAAILGKFMIQEDVPFSGFCSRNAECYENGLLGKPVYTHETIAECKADTFLIVPTVEHFSSALERIKSYHFPEERILPFFRGDMIKNRPYFEFMDHFEPGTAFVDGGCYDGATSLEFAGLSNGGYSGIYAFEPDEANLRLCEEKLNKTPVSNFKLVPAGLGKTNEVLAFASGNGESCRFICDAENRSESNVTYVKIVDLDSIVGEEKVGFIKLDIEGAEMDALCGAKKTILRDKPFLAICVYHKNGDQLALMNYLHSLVPEYKFWLRHYSTIENDTILYAMVIH